MAPRRDTISTLNENCRQPVSKQSARRFRLTREIAKAQRDWDAVNSLIRRRPYTKVRR